MQDLKYFVDVVEGVHSGGTSLFGLRKRKYSRDHLITRSPFTHNKATGIFDSIDIESSA